MNVAVRADAHSLEIAGLVPLSTVDWPGRLVATAFLQGCPWRCGYCHNPELLPTRTPGRVAWAAVEALLAKRHGLLDGLVLSGGEPTRQPGVLDAARRVRAAGYAVGLHTAGAHPGRLTALLGEVDWVGLDVKATPGGYAGVTGVAASGERAWVSLEAVLASGVAHEVRTTVEPGGIENAWRTAQRVRVAGARVYALQQARPVGPDPEPRPPGWDEDFAALAKRVAGLGFERLEVRPA